MAWNLNCTNSDKGWLRSLTKNLTKYKSIKVKIARFAKIKTAEK